MFYLEADDVAAFPAELHANKVDRLAQGAIFINVTLGFELFDGLAFGQQFDHLEFEQPHPLSLSIRSIRTLKTELSEGPLRF